MPPNPSPSPLLPNAPPHTGSWLHFFFFFFFFFFFPLPDTEKEWTQINMVQRIIWYWNSYFADFWSLSPPLPPPPNPQPWQKKKKAICQPAVPLAEWLKPITFSVLNRPSSHRCGFEPSSGDKPSSACGWSDGFSRGSPVSPTLWLARLKMSEIILTGPN